VYQNREIQELFSGSDEQVVRRRDQLRESLFIK